LKVDQHIPHKTLDRYFSGKISCGERKVIERCVADTPTWRTQEPEPKMLWWNRLWIVLLICAFAADVQSQTQRSYDAQHPPRFEEFPVTEKWQPPAAPVQLTTRSERMFKTNLTKASKQPPEFAGHFSIASWGCGSVCMASAFVDLKTGEVIPPPSPAPRKTGWDRWMMCTAAFEGSGFEVRIDSRLVKFTCGFNEPTAPKPLTPRVAYYVLEGNQFRLLLDIPGTSN
jgi:hypothetical protein